MGFRTVLTLIVLWLVVGTSANAYAGSWLPRHVDDTADPISGDWQGRFEIGGASATVSFKLRLDGHKLTGTAESAHTGPGKLSQGSVVDKKLAFTLDFAAHESISVTGTLQDGKLSGEFRTEGMIGKWTAWKQVAPTSNEKTKPGDTSQVAPEILSPVMLAGEWNATFEADGATVPVTLKLQIDGDTVSGTTASEHLGAGKISSGTLVDNKLTFNMDISFGTVKVTGVLKDSKLVGEFDLGAMHGKFEAAKNKPTP